MGERKKCAWRVRSDSTTEEENAVCVGSSWRKTRKRREGKGGNVSRSSCQCRGVKQGLAVVFQGSGWCQLCSVNEWWVPAPVWNRELDSSPSTHTTVQCERGTALVCGQFQPRAVVKMWKNIWSGRAMPCKGYFGLGVPSWQLGTIAVYGSPCCLSNLQLPS